MSAGKDTSKDGPPTSAGGDEGGYAPSPGAVARESEPLEREARRTGVTLRDVAPDPRLPDIRMGPDRYEVLQEIGSGGMGTVFLVHDRDLGRSVALKMSRSSDYSPNARFIEEARVMGQLQHPNIVTVHELGLADGRRPYYTMPQLRGQTLKGILQALRAGEPRTLRTWSLTRLIQVFLQVAQAIDYAHHKGVLHRDLKPANVMLGEHGEVQVLDWGLSKLLEASGLDLDEQARHTPDGQIVGTPGYMAPEQITGGPVDARSDVYALGVLLYELLTLRLPFQGTRQAIAMAVVRDDPPPPRLRAPDRVIPRELERIALRALLRDASARYQSAGELLDAVQTWLEAESDRARRHELAEERARDGAATFAEYRRLKGEVATREREAAELGAAIKGWQPVEEKRELARARQAVRATRRRLARAGSESVAKLSAALAVEQENHTARDTFADFYWDRLVDAELEGQELDIDYFGQLVAEYDDGRYAAKLQGDGALELGSEPAGAEVWLSELVEEDFQLVPRGERCVGLTPLADVRLAMGSYLAILRLDGYADVRYPVHIGRNQIWSGSVELCRPGEIEAGFVFVPGGEFIEGGDPDTRGTCLPRATPSVEDFFIGRHPVTMSEYLEYLNELVAAGREAEAMERSPRRTPEGGSYLVKGAAGLLALPDVDAEGDHWQPSLPACGVSYLDAVAYCRWRSQREGRELRLPSEREWEKAARGVDGRRFPWGNEFDPSLCNMVESSRGRPSPRPVDDYPTDASVYGVRGMAGNMRDWTETEHREGEGNEARVARVVRGGSWNLNPTLTRCAYRSWNDPSTPNVTIGFRLARSR